MGVPETTTSGGSLERSRSRRWIAGVCGGLGEYFGLSVTLIRLLFVIFAVTGIGEFVYLVLWVVMPNAVRRRY